MMGASYSTAVEAISAGSFCNFQVPLPAFPLPAFGLPSIPIPDFPELPTVVFFCPLDEAPEEVPK